MPATIPEGFQDLLQKKAFAHVATIMADGSPQVTPVWFDFDGSHIRVNSAKGRVKEIVEKKHRRAYDRAATLVTAVAEARIINGDADRGHSLLGDIRDQYRRYYAFTGELDKVARRSPLLPSPPSKRRR